MEEVSWFDGGLQAVKTNFRHYNRDIENGNTLFKRNNSKICARGS